MSASVPAHNIDISRLARPLTLDEHGFLGAVAARYGATLRSLEIYPNFAVHEGRATGFVAHFDERGAVDRTLLVGPHYECTTLHAIAPRTIASNTATDVAVTPATFATPPPAGVLPRALPLGAHGYGVDAYKAGRFHDAARTPSIGDEGLASPVFYEERDEGRAVKRPMMFVRCSAPLLCAQVQAHIDAAAAAKTSFAAMLASREPCEAADGTSAALVFAQAPQCALRNNVAAARVLTDAYGVRTLEDDMEPDTYGPNVRMQRWRPMVHHTTNCFVRGAPGSLCYIAGVVPTEKASGVVYVSTPLSELLLLHGPASVTSEGRPKPARFSTRGWGAPGSYCPTGLAVRGSPHAITPEEMALSQHGKEVREHIERSYYWDDVAAGAPTPYFAPARLGSTTAELLARTNADVSAHGAPDGAITRLEPVQMCVPSFNELDAPLHAGDLATAAAPHAEIGARPISGAAPVAARYAALWGLA